MKQRLSLILVLILAVSAISCESIGTSHDSSLLNDSSEITADTTADRFSDDLPELKYDGRTITFGVSYISTEDIIADEENGDVVNDAIVARNRTVEERFDVKIEKYLVSDENYRWYEKMINLVLAGDNVCDIAGHYAYHVYKAVSNGIYYDWNTIQYVDQTKPWWSRKINESATMNGKLYAISGYLGMTTMDYTTALFFNQRLLNEFGYDSSELYKMVYDGSWTIDRFSEIIKNMYRDLNSDGNRDDDDLYGYATQSPDSLDNWQTAFNIPISRKTKDGKIELDVVSEKRVSALEKINTLYKSNTGARLITNPSYKSSWKFYENFNFANGRQVFTPSIFRAAGTLYRDMKDTYGIIPLPKWDENQDEYYSNICDEYAIWGVPMTVTDTDFVGLVTEALACETMKTVYPAYYDIALKNKYSNDEDTARMVDIVTSGTEFDITCMFGKYLEGAPYLFRTQIVAGTDNLVSAYAAVESKIAAGLAEIESFYK